jgi:hypothetical protein
VDASALAQRLVAEDQALAGLGVGHGEHAVDGLNGIETLGEADLA